LSISHTHSGGHASRNALRLEAREQNERALGRAPLPGKREKTVFLGRPQNSWPKRSKYNQKRSPFSWGSSLRLSVKPVTAHAYPSSRRCSIKLTISAITIYFSTPSPCSTGSRQLPRPVSVGAAAVPRLRADETDDRSRAAGCRGGLLPLQPGPRRRVDCPARRDRLCRGADHVPAARPQQGRGGSIGGRQRTARRTTSAISRMSRT